MKKKYTVCLIPPLPIDQWISIHQISSLLFEALSSVESEFEFVLADSEKFVSRNRLLNTVNRRLVFPMQLKTRKADIYHIIDQSYANLVHFLPTQKTLVTCHDFEFWRKRSLKNHIVRKNILSGLAKARTISCVSDTTRDELRALLPKTKARITTIPNGISSRFTALELQERKQQRLKLKIDEKFALLHVGTAHMERKNVDFIFPLLRKLLDQGVPAHFVQIGSHFTDSQKKLIEENGIEPYVQQIHFANPDDLVLWYQCADVCLMPSLYEGFGLPIIESMACGTPVVCSDIEVFREIGGEPALALPLQLDKWVEALIQLASDSEKFEQCRQTSLQQSEGFSYPAVAERYLAEYREMIHGQQL